jgi:hypothetical protein
MNKEQQELVGEVYQNYSNKLLFNEKDCHVDYSINQPNKTFIPYSQEEFINKCKTDSEFSERWGLKIEERELNYEERIKLFKEKTNRSLTYTLNVRERLDENGIPTKLITISYNDKTIESYE